MIALGIEAHVAVATNMLALKLGIVLGTFMFVGALWGPHCFVPQHSLAAADLHSLFSVITMISLIGSLVLAWPFTVSLEMA